MFAILVQYFICNLLKYCRRTHVPLNANVLLCTAFVLLHLSETATYFKKEACLLSAVIAKLCKP